MKVTLLSCFLDLSSSLPQIITLFTSEFTGVCHAILAVDCKAACDQATLPFLSVSVHLNFGTMEIYEEKTVARKKRLAARSSGLQARTLATF